MHIRIQVLEIIPLVLPFPNMGEVLGRYISRVLNKDLSHLLLRVTFKVATNEAPIPTPVIFGVGCGMDTYIPATGLYIAFKISFLILIQQIAGSMQEYDGSILGQRVFLEIISILGSIDLKTVLLAQFGDGSDALGDRTMPVAGGFGKDENAGFAGSGVTATE
jgi:hypothetical protein